VQTKCLLKLNVSINDKQWPKRPYSTQWYFLFYSNCVLSVCVVRQWALAAPGLCSATRYVVHLSLSDRDRLRKTERQKERRKGGRKEREREIEKIKYLWNPERRQVCALLKEAEEWGEECAGIWPMLWGREQHPRSPARIRNVISFSLFLQASQAQQLRCFLVSLITTFAGSFKLLSSL